MTTDTAHYIALATQRQIAGLTAERDALREQVAGLVQERDALRERIAELVAEVQLEKEVAQEIAELNYNLAHGGPNVHFVWRMKERIEELEKQVKELEATA
jgi:cell division protein FtsB